MSGFTSLSDLIRAAGLRTPPPVRGALESRKANPILPGAVLLTEESEQHARAANWGAGVVKEVKPRGRPSRPRWRKNSGRPLLPLATARGMKSPRMSLRQNLLPYAYAALLLRIITVPMTPAAAVVIALATAVVVPFTFNVWKAPVVATTSSRSPAA